MADVFNGGEGMRVRMLRVRILMVVVMMVMVGTYLSLLIASQ